MACNNVLRLGSKNHYYLMGKLDNDMNANKNINTMIKIYRARSIHDAALHLYVDTLADDLSITRL